MALLQIAEPGASPDPHTRRHAVGIDLGTTHSLVAAVRHGVPECLPDAEGRVLLPSAVHYRGDGRTRVGAEDRALTARVTGACPGDPCEPFPGMAYSAAGRVPTSCA